MTIEQRNNLIYGFLALGSIVFLLWVIPAYAPPYPGYGVSARLVPNVAVGIILLLSVLVLVRNLAVYLRAKSTESQEIQAVKEEKSEEQIQADKVRLLHLFRFLIPSALLMPAIQWLGFIPAGILFMLVIQYICGQRKPLPLVLVSVITVGVLYSLMTYLLSVPMP